MPSQSLKTQNLILRAKIGNPCFAPEPLSGSDWDWLKQDRFAITLIKLTTMVTKLCQMWAVTTTPTSNSTSLTSPLPLKYFSLDLPRRRNLGIITPTITLNIPILVLGFIHLLQFCFLVSDCWVLWWLCFFWAFCRTYLLLCACASSCIDPYTLKAYMWFSQVW